VAYLSALILGMQEIYKFNLIAIVRTFSNLLFQIASALLGGGIPGAIWSYLLANIIAFILSLILSRRWVRLYLIDLNPILKKCLSFGIRSYITNLTSFFNYRLDNFIINYYSGPANVGLYSTGVATAEMILYIPNAVSVTTFPKSASLERSASARLTATLCRYNILIIVPLAVIFGLMGIYLIPLIYGKQFQSSTLPFLLLLPGILGVAITKIISANLSGIGKPQYPTYASLATIVVTIILDILLIPRYGINGAAVASTVSYLLGAILLIYLLTAESNLTWNEIIIPTFADLSFLITRTRQLIREIITKTKMFFQPGEKPL
jgi:O-antigen/teichoic acid export membrane protein